MCKTSILEIFVPCLYIAQVLIGSGSIFRIRHRIRILPKRSGSDLSTEPTFGYNEPVLADQTV